MRIIPLGGLGEIGLNSMIFEHGDQAVLVDCGLMFPTAEMPGVEIVIPDFTYLRENAGRLKAVFLTHGHEDHVGALPYLLREVQVPVYGGPYAIAALRERLEEHELNADLRVTGDREQVRVGDFTLEPLAVTHSTPDALGYVVQSPSATALHTGDFKLDPSPIDGRLTDLGRIGEWGERGIDCLLSDSTNSTETEPTPSEQVVRASMERKLQEAPGRVVVALFASNLHRVKHLLESARKTGRKVALAGRSMLRNYDLGWNLEYLDTAPDLVVPLDAVRHLPPREVCILTTGAQGEARSGLQNMLTDQPGGDRYYLQAGDTVIFSARVIPGNERAVAGLIEQLHLRGCVVLTPEEEPDLHVSGHASPDQQRQVLELARPRAFVPIHGEPRHLRCHLDLARDAGIHPDGLVLARDGDVVEVEGGRARLAGRTAAGRIFRDRFGTGAVLTEALRDRQRLADAGALACVVVLDRSNHQTLQGPFFSGRGLGEEETRLLPSLTQTVRALFDQHPPVLRADEALAREELVAAVRRAFKQHELKRPTVLPVIIKL